jgi:hypothetical protein
MNVAVMLIGFPCAWAILDTIPSARACDEFRGCGDYNEELVRRFLEAVDEPCVLDDLLGDRGG